MGAMAMIYKGKIQLEGDSNRLPAVITIDEGRIIISSNNQPIGDWPLKSSGFEWTERGVVLSVTDGKLLMLVDEPEALATAVGLRSKRSKRLQKIEERQRSERNAGSEEKAPSKERPSAKEVISKVSEDLDPFVADVREGLSGLKIDRNMIIGGVVLLILAFIFTSISIPILTIIGAILVLAGAIGLLEPTFEHRFPYPFTPIRVLAGGASAFVLVVLILLIR